jgi:hypothetical protein
MGKWLRNSQDDDILDELIERQINLFMVSYTNAINKQLCRKGGLFQSPFKRTFINEEAYLQQAIIYVHANPQKHGLVKDFRNYPYSSYQEILQKNSLYVNRDEVIDFFGGEGRFVEQHKLQADTYYKGSPK